MSRSTRAACVAALAVLTIAAPASAARTYTPDGTGDVYRKDAEGPVFSEVGTRTNIDLVGSAVRNADRRVHGSARYDDLVRNQDRIVMPIRLHVSTGRTYLMRVEAGPSDRDGTASLHRYTGTGNQLRRVACDGIQHSVSYRDDLIMVSVPRGCLGSPTWVEYGGTARTVGPDGTVFTDTFLDSGPVNDLYSERIKRG